MTLEKVHMLKAMHTIPGSGYDQNTAKSVSGDVMRNHGQAAAYSLIREYGLEELRGIKPGTKLESAFKS